MILLLAQTAELRDLKPPETFASPWPWVAGALGLLVGLLAGYLYRKRRSHSQAALPVPPADQARSALQALREKLEVLSADTFTVEASRILRRYLEDALALPASERTTEEFLPAAAMHPRLQGDQASLLRDFLTQCDLVKFARQEVDLPGRHQLLDLASRLIDAVEQAATAEAYGSLKTVEPK